MKSSYSITTFQKYKTKAKILEKKFNVTDLYKFEDQRINEYLGGGFGRENGYESILIYGDTGIGKSVLTLNMIAAAMKQGKTVGMMILEDDMADVYNRLKKIIPGSDIDSSQHIILSDDELEKVFTLDDVCEMMKIWFKDLKADIIFLDHLQFLFEAASSESKNAQWNEQRMFMRQLMPILKKLNKTIVIVSHINKSKEDGMAQIMGSSGIYQSATKVIELRVNDDQEELVLRKSRFTKKKNGGLDSLPVKLSDFKLTVDDKRKEESGSNESDI